MGVASDVLQSILARGVSQSADGYHLRDAGEPAVSEDELDYLRAFRPEVLATLAAREAAIAWRETAMQEQCPTSGPLPFLVARPVPIGVAANTCLSCNDPLDGASRLRCRACVEAVGRVLSIGRRSSGSSPRSMAKW